MEQNAIEKLTITISGDGVREVRSALIESDNDEVSIGLIANEIILIDERPENLETTALERQAAKTRNRDRTIARTTPYTSEGSNLGRQHT